MKDQSPPPPKKVVEDHLPSTMSLADDPKLVHLVRKTIRQRNLFTATEIVVYLQQHHREYQRKNVERLTESVQALCKTKTTTTTKPMRSLIVLQKPTMLCVGIATTSTPACVGSTRVRTHRLLQRRLANVAKLWSPNQHRVLKRLFPFEYPNDRKNGILIWAVSKERCKRSEKVSSGPCCIPVSINTWESSHREASCCGDHQERTYGEVVQRCHSLLFQRQNALGQCDCGRIGSTVLSCSGHRTRIRRFGGVRVHHTQLVYRSLGSGSRLDLFG